jgi:hypothetical protein
VCVARGCWPSRRPLCGPPRAPRALVPHTHSHGVYRGPHCCGTPATARCRCRRASTCTPILAKELSDHIRCCRFSGAPDSEERVSGESRGTEEGFRGFVGNMGVVSDNNVSYEGQQGTGEVRGSCISASSQWPPAPPALLPRCLRIACAAAAGQSPVCTPLRPQHDTAAERAGGAVPSPHWP